MWLTNSQLRRIPANLGLAAVYFLTATLALGIADNGYVSPFWPPTGISVAALLLAGVRLLPGVFLGAFLVNWQVDGASLTALQIAAGNSLEAFTACWLINRFISRRYFLNYSRHIFAFTLSLALAAALGALIGSHALAGWPSAASWSAFVDTWFVWWLGDMAGGLIFAPLLLVFARRYRSAPRSGWEMLLFAALVILVGEAVFGGWIALQPDNAPFAFLSLPLLIAIGYRLGLRGSALAVLYLTLTATRGTLSGYGPFVQIDTAQSLLLQQLFISCIALCSLLLCAVLDERERAQQALLRLSNQLERRMAAATLELRQKNLTLNTQQQAQQQLIGELRTSEGRYRALFENAAEAVVLFNLDSGKFVDANDNAIRLFGLSRSQLLQISVADVSPPRQANGRLSAELARRYVERAVAGEKCCFEWLHLGADGHPISCEVRLVAFPSRDDHLVRASITDITPRRQAEERQRLVAKLFENTSEAVIITDREQRIVEVNEAFCKISGYPAEEVLGLTPSHFASGLHGSDFYREMWQVLDCSGRWQGEIWDRRKDGELYPKWLSVSVVKDSAGQVTHYLGQFTDITESKAREARLLELATYDHLTGLHNRNSLLDHLAQAIWEAARARTEFAIFFIDLDGFKRVNDSLGHDVGDRLLRAVADRLKQNCRASDLVARLGGDEFTLLAKQPHSGIDQARLADKLLRALASPYDLDTHAIHLTASIGISRYPIDGTEGKELLKNADMAMYRAKSEGRNGYQFYTAEMKAQVQRQMGLEMELRRAVENAEFVLHYQPQIELHSGRLVGVEALLRWQHPQEGLLLPGAFIDVAEQSGLICQIGHWVLQAACWQARRWQQEHQLELPVAVNLSAQQFRQPRKLLRQVDRALASSGLPPMLLELELTESMLLDNVDEAFEVLAGLREAGIRVAIDDFGTGYSSLAYLKQLAADKLKIDRSFVRDLEQNPDDAEIVRATIALGHSLNLKVIAEGVENEAQKDFLSALGCDQMQGHYVSVALPAEALLDFIERQQLKTPQQQELAPLTRTH